jgi:hypothetical protein
MPNYSQKERIEKHRNEVVVACREAPSHRLLLKLRKAVNMPKRRTSEVWSNKHTNNMTNIHFLFKEQGIHKVVIKDVGCNTCSGWSTLAQASGKAMYDNIRCRE